ncbi:zinc metallopeptidase [Priestia megaterium]|uniref:zinc metallopeptidase n=1 Tax=Priestia megaterium TaxID=1404 RepID=UPI00268D30B7|nr:zinc metallopeptidase [Priestia megaterium]
MIIIYSLIVNLVGYLLIRILEEKINKLHKSFPSPSLHITGKNATRDMIETYLGKLQIKIKKGPQCAYLPRRSIILLTEEVMKGNSISAWSSGCHEVGHLIQDIKGYKWFRRKEKLDICHVVFSYLAIVLMVSFYIPFLKPQYVEYSLIGLYVFLLILYIPTILIEFDATKRGMHYLKEQGITDAETRIGWRMGWLTLMTYIVVLLIPTIQIFINLINKIPPVLHRK